MVHILPEQKSAYIVHIQNEIHFVVPVLSMNQLAIYQHNFEHNASMIGKVYQHIMKNFVLMLL